MKLIKKQNVNEGQIYPTDVFISFGKRFPDDGWYFRIESPFSFVDKNFYDLLSNTYSPTKCRKVYALIYRKTHKFTKLYSVNYLINKGISWQ